MTTLLDPKLPEAGLAGSYINGAWHKPASGDTLTIENPSRRAPICEVGRGTATEVNLAVEAARAALPAWRSLAASERGKLLAELGRRLEENAEGWRASWPPKAEMPSKHNRVEKHSARRAF